jgi:succinyl-CoA synthetase alpha subunit
MSGLASRSGTISYELAAQTTALGLGQSIVFGLGGDPFPGTRTHEALSLMLSDPHTKVICVIGEIGGQMEEEVAEVYKNYLATLPAGTTPKPVVGFVAGVNTERGLMYGHAGAIWWDAAETARSKKKCWEQAGIRVVETMGEVGGVLVEEAKRVGAA